MTAGWSDLDILTYTLYAEARGEGRQGIVMVAGVISNRAALKHLSQAQVCLEPKQFSCWNGVTRAPVKPNDASWRLCREIAKQKHKSRYTHYFAHNQCFPKWAKRAKQAKVVGGHTFLTLNGGKPRET